MELATVTDVARHTGLSHALLTVLYDFFSHTLAQQQYATGDDAAEDKACRKKKKHHFQHIVCHNSTVPRVTNNGDIKARLVKREASLRHSYGPNSGEKDCQLIHEFLGWAQTVEGGHWVMVYYVGPDCDNDADKEAEMQRYENWKLVNKDHLSFFHSRLGRDVTPLFRYSALDIVETSDGRGNLALDLRYVANKWLMTNNNLATYAGLLWNARHLFARPEQDYVQHLHKYRENHGMEKPVPVFTTPVPLLAAPPVESVQLLLTHYGYNAVDELLQVVYDHDYGTT